MKRHKNMSKWYPLEGYSYADVNCKTVIEKMMDSVNKISKDNTLGENEKREQIRAIYEAVTEIAFEHEVAYDRVINYISWLYSADDDAAAFDLALKLFSTLEDMVNPKTRVLEEVCDWVELLADANDAMTDELEDKLMFARSYVHNS